MNNPITELIRVEVTRIRDRMKGHVVFGQRISTPDLELLAAYYLGHFDGKQESPGTKSREDQVAALVRDVNHGR